MVADFIAMIGLGVPVADLIEEADATGSQLRQLAKLAEARRA
jgi:hypothetical protein